MVFNIVGNYNDLSGFLYEPEVDRNTLHDNDQKILKDLLAKYKHDGQPPLDPARRFCVTASDLASICGENPYKKSDEVLRDKRYRITFGDNENTLHGKRYEPVAIEIISRMTIDGSKVKNVYNITFVQHGKYGWIGGTLDGLVELEDGRVFVLEVKCPLKRRIQTGVMPDYYMPQVQTYMYITGLNACIFFQYRPPMGLRGKEKMDVLLLKRDPLYIPTRLRTMKTFRDKMVVWRYAQEQCMTCVALYIQNRWRSKRMFKGKSMQYRSGVYTTNLLIMLRLCSDRMRFLLQPPEAMCECKDNAYMLMATEMMSTTKPITKKDMGIGDIECVVRVEE